jgi:hypothetical protein
MNFMPYFKLRNFVKQIEKISPHYKLVVPVALIAGLSWSSASRALCGRMRPCTDDTDRWAPIVHATLWILFSADEPTYLPNWVHYFLVFYNNFYKVGKTNRLESL